MFSLSNGKLFSVILYDECKKLTMEAIWYGLNDCFFDRNDIIIRPDLKICWFALTRPGLQETYGSNIFFDAHSWKKCFSHKYIILAMITLQNKVNFLLFLLHHFKCSYCIDFFTHCPLRRFHYTALQYTVK